VILDTEVDKIVIVCVYIIEWLVAVISISKGNDSGVDRKKDV
jgi:hypothetical protein